MCYWPAQVEERGPRALLAQLTAPSRPPPDWEVSVPGLAVAQGPCQLLHDQRAVHDMSWPSADVFWEAMTREGPWHR